MTKMQWPRVLSVNTGRDLKMSISDMWYAELCKDLSELQLNTDEQNDELICAAIRWAHRDGSTMADVRNKFDLDKNDLRKWVQAYQGHAKCSGEDKVARRQRNAQLLDDLKQAISEETDPCRIWDLICTPRVQDGFKDKVYSYLECYVIEVHPDWQRPEEYIASKWDAVKAAMAGVAEHVHDEPRKERDNHFKIGREGSKTR